MSRALLNVLLFLAAVYAVLVLLLFVFQRSMLYFPQPRASGGPGSTMLLRVDDADLMVSVLIREGRKAVVYFGGNAEDVAQSLEEIARIFPQHAIFMLHYRGYGGSSGKPTEAAIHRDAAALLDKVKVTYPGVTLVGRSLGSGVAVRLAAQSPVERLILVTPYDSIADVAASVYPIFPVRHLLLDTYESILHAPRVTAPTTMVVAEHDEVIPRASSERLAQHFAPGLVDFRIVTGTGHNNIQNSIDYFRALAGAPR